MDLPKLAAPAQRALAGARVKTLKDLAKRTERETAELHGMGPSALRTLKTAMRAEGLSFLKAPPPTSKEVDAYLAKVPPHQRPALEKLRAAIRSVVPDATEVMSYGLPTFKLKRNVVAYGAFKDHLSIFAMNPDVQAKFASELKGYKMSKGTIQFTPEKPLPAALVKKLVKARMEQTAE